MPRTISRIGLIGVIVALCLAAFAAVKFVSYAKLGTVALRPVGPNVAVTDTLLEKTPDDSKADANERLKGTITTTNNGTDASGVTIKTTLPAELTLDGTTVKASPVAVNDLYDASATGSLTNAASILGNDYAFPAPTITSVGSCASAPFTNCTTTLGGTVTVNADGTFNYTKETGDTGTDTFTYTIDNTVAPPNASDATATVSLKLDANAAPVITTANTANVPENTTAVIDVDVAADPDGPSPITFSITGGADSTKFGIAPTAGVLTFNTAPNFEALASAGGNNTYIVEVSAYDGAAYTPQTITVTVTDVNEAPTANPDTASVTEAGGVNNGTAGMDITSGFNVIAGSGTGSVADTDPDAGTTLTVVGAAVGTQAGPLSTGVNTVLSGAGALDYGTFTIQSSGSYTYTVNQTNTAVQGLRPSSDTLTDTFSYTVSDGSLKATTTVTVTIHGANDNPVATVDNATAAEAGGSNNGTAGTDPSGNVLTNDTDVDVNGETKAVEAVIDGNKTAAQLLSTCPTTCNVGVGISANSPNDYGTLTVQSNGAYTYVVNQANAAVQALAPASSPLTDTFTYRMRDAAGATSTTIITIAISGADDLPTAVNDTATVAEDSGATAIPVLTNDSNTDGGPISITAKTNGSNGTVVITGGGTGLTYQPNADFNGSDSFTYTLNGGSVGTVNVTVTEVNDTPVVTNDTLSDVNEDSPKRVIPFATLLSNDSPGPANEIGQALTITAVSSPTGGTVAINGTNVEFTPAADFFGAAGFTYTVQDNGTTNGANDFKTANGTLSFNILAVNDAPTFTVPSSPSAINEDAGAQSISSFITNVRPAQGGVTPNTTEDSQTVSFVITNNTNSALFSSGPGLTVTGASYPKTATLAYAPAANANGTATITYHAHDTGGTSNGGVEDSADQTFTITVNAVNDAPVPVAKAFTAQANMKIQGITGLLTGATDPDKTNGDLAYTSFDDGYTPTFTVTTGSIQTGGATPCGASTVISNVNTATGTFDFDPPAGFSGTCTLVYQLTDSGNPGPGVSSANATITVTVNGPVIWFVNSAAASNGDGRLSSPFKFLAGNAGANNDADDVDGASQHVFLYSGATAYNGGLTLNSSETLRGQPTTAAADFDTLYGISPPAGTITRPTIGSGNKPSIVNTGGIGVGLVSGNTLDCLQFEDTSGNAVSSTANVGTLLLRDIVVLNDGSSGAGIILDDGGTSVTTAGTNTIMTTTGTALNVTNTTIGAGNLTFKSISAGTAASGPANGIILNATGSSGSLIVQGGANSPQGGDNSGGTIQKTTGAAISLINTLGPSFTNIRVINTTGDGILGTRVTNFTLRNSRFDANGAAADESNVSFRGDLTGSNANVSGTVSVTDNVLNNAHYHGVDIQNYTGTLSSVIITGNSLTSQTSSNAGTFDSQGSGIRLIAFGTASSHADVTKATIDNNTIRNFPVGDGIQVQGGNSVSGGPATVLGVVGNATNIIGIAGNRISGASAAIKLGGNAIVISTRGTGQANVNVDGNGVAADPIQNILGIGVVFSAFGPMNFVGTINNNYLSNLGNIFGSQGIDVGIDSHFALTDAGSMSAKITNNTVSGHDGNGIFAIARNSSASLDVTVTGNNVAAPLGGVRSGIQVSSGSASGDTSLCADIQNNTSAGSGGTQGIGLRKQGSVSTTNSFGVEGMAATATPGVETYVSGKNPSGNGVLLTSATSGFSTCSSAPNAPSTAVASLPSQDFPGSEMLDVKPTIPLLADNAAALISDPAALLEGQGNIETEPFELGSRSGEVAFEPLSNMLGDGGRKAVAERLAPGLGGGAAHGLFEPLTNILGVSASVDMSSEPPLLLATPVFDCPEHLLGFHADVDILRTSKPATAETVNAVVNTEELSADTNGSAATSFFTELFEKLTASIEPAAYSKGISRGNAKRHPAPLAPPVTPTICLDNDNLADCAGPGFTLPAGKSIRLTYEADVKNGPFSAGVNNLVDSTTIAWTGTPAGFTTASASIPLDAAPDLKVVATDGGTTTTPGGTVAYTLNWLNVSPASGTNNTQDATGVVLSATIPANSTFSTADSDPSWSCPNNNAGTTCTIPIGAVAAGGNGSPVFAVKVPLALASGAEKLDLLNSVTIVDDTSNGTDLNPADNTSTETTNIIGNWIGDTSTDWNDPLNWSNNTSPASGQNISIPAGNPNAPALGSGTATVAILTLNGADVTIGSGARIIVTSTAALGANKVLGAGTLELQSGGTITRTSGQVNCALQKDFTNGAIAELADSVAAPVNPPFVYPVGTGSGYFPATATMDSSSNGSLTVQAFDGAPALLDSSKALARRWHLTTLGTVLADLTFDYTGTATPGTGAPGNYHPIRTNPGATSYVENCPSGPCVNEGSQFIFMPNLGTSEINGDWTAGQQTFIPTAAAVTVSGRVTDATGSPLRNARVEIDGGIGVRLTTLTNAFGYYRFDGVQSGQAYVLSAGARGYIFVPRVIVVNDTIADMEIRALP